MIQLKIKKTIIPQHFLSYFYFLRTKIFQILVMIVLRLLGQFLALSKTIGCHLCQTEMK